MSTDHISVDVMDKVKLKYSEAKKRSESIKERERERELARSNNEKKNERHFCSVYLMLVTFYAQEVNLTFASARRMLNQKKNGLQNPLHSS